VALRAITVFLLEEFTFATARTERAGVDPPGPRVARTALGHHRINRSTDQFNFVFSGEFNRASAGWTGGL